MVTKRIRSEYMKNFKDPKWETYTKCYEEMLAYRLTRRLLEHTHNPWFWTGSDSDSDSGGRSPPRPSKNQVEDPEGVKMDRQQETRTTGAGTKPGPKTGPKTGPKPGPGPGAGHAVQNEEQIRPDPHLSAHSSQCDDTRESNKAVQGEEEEFSAPLRDKEKEIRAARPRRRKPSKLTRPAWRSQRVRPVRQLQEDTKEKRHPFALYGSGEKDADIADRKTHNVGPAASTAEIHESALRAKTRRQVERQIQSRQPEQRRAKSVDPNKTVMAVQPEFNPWLTEYMRCFSARSR